MDLLKSGKCEMLEAEVAGRLPAWRYQGSPKRRSNRRTWQMQEEVEVARPPRLQEDDAPAGSQQMTKRRVNRLVQLAGSVWTSEMLI